MSAVLSSRPEILWAGACRSIATGRGVSPPHLRQLKKKKRVNDVDRVDLAVGRSRALRVREKERDGVFVAERRHRWYTRARRAIVRRRPIGRFVRAGPASICTTRTRAALPHSPQVQTARCPAAVRPRCWARRRLVQAPARRRQLEPAGGRRSSSSELRRPSRAATTAALAVARCGSSCRGSSGEAVADAVRLPGTLEARGEDATAGAVARRRPAGPVHARVPDPNDNHAISCSSSATKPDENLALRRTPRVGGAGRTLVTSPLREEVGRCYARAWRRTASIPVTVAGVVANDAGAAAACSPRRRSARRGRRCRVLGERGCLEPLGAGGTRCLTE